MFPADFFARREHVRSVFWTLFIKGVALFYVTLCFVPFLVYVSCMFSFFLRPFCKSLKLFSQNLPFPFSSVFFLHLFHLALQEMRAKQTTVYKVYTREWENDWVDEEGKVRIF
jgi:hypothetical protein